MVFYGVIVDATNTLIRRNTLIVSGNLIFFVSGRTNVRIPARRHAKPNKVIGAALLINLYEKKHVNYFIEINDSDAECDLVKRNFGEILKYIFFILVHCY